MATPVVRTPYGPVAGIVRDEIECFYNIPYAAPPLGELRFAPARASERWSATLDGSAPGPIAPQPKGGIGSYVPGDPLHQSEDCLTLNIFRDPNAATRSGAPVLVFIHGGAFLTGNGASAMYDGSHLARRGLVVVTLNYRLGALGFLAHRLLADDASGMCGNWGLSDICAALDFVRRCVSSFGGDPTRVTLVGESAGAMAIADLLAAPAANGLFSAAVLESGADLAGDLASAERVTEELCAALGLREVDRRALVAAPLAEIEAAALGVVERSGGMLAMSFRPVVEPGLLPESPARVLSGGGGARVPLVVGTNRDEFKLFTALVPEARQMDDAKMRSLALESAGRAYPTHELDLEPVIGAIGDELREAGAEPTPLELFEHFGTDLVFRLPALRLAEARAALQPVFVYEFNWPSPFFDGALGACHGIELPFVFGTVRNPVVALFAGSGERAEGLADLLGEAWAAFCRTGSPSCETLGSWPEYLPGRRTMLLGERCGDAGAWREPSRLAWEEVLPRYGEVG
jgi:para-nitrobenzyl esterase